MADVDHAVTKRIANILTDDVIQDVLADVRAEFEPERRDEQHEQVARELADIERTIARTTEAIGTGLEDVPELAARLQGAHHRRQALRQALNAIEDESEVRLPKLAHPGGAGALAPRRLARAPVSESDRRTPGAARAPARALTVHADFRGDTTRRSIPRRR